LRHFVLNAIAALGCWIGWQFPLRWWLNLFVTHQRQNEHIEALRATWDSAVTPAEAHQIIDTLAKGIDPDTGEMLHLDSCLNNPHTIRALFLASKALDAVARRSEANEGRPGKAGKPWSAPEEERLLRAFDAGATVDELASNHERSSSGIASRLVRFGRIKDRSEVQAPRSTTSSFDRAPEMR
jgi:hypothetical protein